MFLPITKTDIAKSALKMIVAANVKRVSTEIIVEHTDYTEDSIAVDVTTSVVGWYASSRFTPVTDAIVDKTIERVQSWRNRKDEENPES